MESSSFAYISAGIAMGIAAVGTGLSIGHIVGKAVEGTARQPEAGGQIRTTMIIGMAFVEAIALYTLVISFILVAK